MRLFALVFLRLKRFLSWFLSSFRQRAFCCLIFNRTLRRTSMYVHVARGPTNKFKSHGQSYEGGNQRWSQQQQQPHNEPHRELSCGFGHLGRCSRNCCLLYLSLGCLFFSLVRCSHWILFLACFKACGFLCCALAKNKGWHHPKADAEHQMSTMNLESSLEFCTRGRRRRGSKRGWKGPTSTSPARNKHFVCAIKVPLLLIPSPLSPTCYSFASPFLAINSLHKFRLCCIIKKLNSFFLYLSLSLFLFWMQFGCFNLELEWKLFARLMRSRLAALSLELRRGRRELNGPKNIFAKRFAAVLSACILLKEVTL